MITVTPQSFSSHEAWLDHVSQNVPDNDQPFALALGRLELYRAFYRTRHETLPAFFEEDFKRIQTLLEPERTTQLECMNDWIFAQLVETLRDEARNRDDHSQPLSSQTPRERTEELIRYLTDRSLYFKLWTTFKATRRSSSSGVTWEKYVERIVPAGDRDELAFANRMAEFGELLCYFRDNNQPLPEHFTRRAWFLHHLRGKERVIQTQALLGVLTSEIRRCGCA